MRLVAAGISFQSAPLRVRERAVVGEDDARQLLRYLVGRAGLMAAVVLSTCNRTEFYVICPDDASAAAVLPQLGRYLDPGNGELSQHLVSHSDAAAIDHIFRVAAGLESMVVGEPQVLGQMKAAHRLAQECGTVTGELDLVLRRAIEVGKRVRTDTVIGRGAGSLSEVAARAADGHLSAHTEKRALVIGAGRMGRLVGRRLHQSGIEVLVSSRTEASAERLAQELETTTVARDGLVAALATVDVVVSSTSSPAHVISARDVALWQAERRGRPLLIIDLAVPRDVDPAACEIGGVKVIDVDDLGRLVDDGLAARRRAIPDADALIEAAVAETRQALLQRLSADPAIAHLVEYAETLRQAELARSVSSLDGADAQAIERLDRLSRSLMRKLLHAPIQSLRRHADDPARCAEILEALLSQDADDRDPKAESEIAGRVRGALQRT